MPGWPKGVTAMGIMLGGELGTMDNLSREFSKQIQTVDGLVAAIDAQVNNVQWTGKVADDFRSQWHGEFQERPQSAADGAPAVLGPRPQPARRHRPGHERLTI